ncbi:MAG TPA: lipopolysaccharide biosynthesis protein [Blastocatellia bacterium]|nr:lipopolysaccharide biosynthesis protein [Blastocatellia bacterium]
MRVTERAELDGVERESPDAVPLFERTIGAFAWRFLSESSTFVLRLFVNIILARLLPVDAFGLLTLVMIVTNLAYRVSQIGMAPAIIQRKELTKRHVRVAFTVSILSGVVISAAIWASAPAVAAIFRNDAAPQLLRFISLSFLFSSFGSTSAALLERKLDYRKLFLVELTSYSIGYALVGIILAASGAGVWALAWAMVVESVIRAGLLFTASPHSLRPSFAQAEARQLLNFGVGSSLSRLANYAALNGDYFVVGRWLGAVDLGLYSRAYQLVSLPMYQFSSVISLVLFPVYSRMQDDTAALKRAYIASVFFSAIIVIPLLTMLAISAPEVMAGVFGPQWTGAIAPLQILCLGGIFHSIYNLGDSLARAKGAVYLKFGCHAVYATCVIVGSVIGSTYGINGVAIGVVVALSVIYLLLGQLSIYLTKSRWREFFLSQLPGVVFGVSVAVLAMPVTSLLRAKQLPHLVILAVTVAASMIGVIAAALLLPNRWLSKSSLGAIDKVQQYCTDNLKARVKAYLRHNETAYKVVEVIYDNFLVLRHIIQNGFWGVAGFRHGSFRRAPNQAAITWNVPFPHCDSPGELIAWFRSRGIEVSEGGHTFYIPPQEGLSEIIPSIIRFYPPGTGFKVLKDFRHPARARYLYNHRKTLIVLKRLLGTPQDRLVAANLMYSSGIGPRIWDLTCWKAKGATYSVFVADHVSGECPTTQQYESFLHQLKRLNLSTHLRILIPKWEENIDFKAPHCNKNLIYSNKLGRVQYIDFQNFGLSNPQAWSEQIISNANRDLPNSNGLNWKAMNRASSNQFTAGMYVPGDKNAGKRWSFIADAFTKSSVSLKGRVVLDIGCNSGATLQSSLVEGAAWGIGWDSPEVVAHTEPLLLSLGVTRFSLIGAELEGEYRLEDDIPEYLRPRLPAAVVFCLSGGDRARLVESLCAIPWRVLVYGGDSSEKPRDFHDKLKSMLTDDLEVIGSSYLAGSDSTVRPISVILRK